LSSIALSRRAAFGLLAVGAIAIGITQRDDPILRATEKRAGLFAWIERNTSPDDVFATSDDYLSVDLALVAQRPVFAGFGFPFREDFFAEYALRDALLFGTAEQRREIAKPTNGEAKAEFFRRLSPRAFAQIAAERQLDYAIVEAGHAKQFSEVEPAFANDHWRVYSVAALAAATSTKSAQPRPH
jgi:hypothetical protein